MSTSLPTRWPPQQGLSLSLQPLGTNLNRQDAPLPPQPHEGPSLSKTKTPLRKVSGHQYFMPLELSLFLCKLLGLPDGQGWQHHPSPGCSPVTTLLAARAPQAGLSCGQSSHPICTEGHSLVLNTGGRRGSQRPSHYSGGLTDGRAS